MAYRVRRGLTVEDRRVSDLPSYLRTEIKKRGVTVTEVARRASVSAATLYRIISGDSMPTMRILHRILFRGLDLSDREAERAIMLAYGITERSIAQ